MPSTLPILLPPVSTNRERAARLDAAQQSIRGFEAATRRHGSLLQALIRGKTVEMFEHYPPNDVRDELSGSQYFYHAHRTEQSEHGHMHLFWHADSRGRRTRRGSRIADWAPTHLFAIGFDDRGLPVSFFTTNWWVTEGYWFDAATTLRMIDRFALGERGRHGSANRFVNGLLQLYRPVIAQLLSARDRRVAQLTRRRAWDKVRSDERHEVMSHLSIDWLTDIANLEDGA